MIIKNLHAWPRSPNDAIEIQLRLKRELILESRFEKLEYVTAVDTAFDEQNNHLYAAAVTVRLPDLGDIERAVAEMEAAFPYIPALLSFREGPVILKALSRLTITPDLVIFAGHGIAHPRGFGLASHLGLLTDTPSIGCARKSLCGDFRLPGNEKGSVSSIFVNNVEAGFVYRTKDNVKPMFISPGYCCELRDALDIIGHLLFDYRMPEPLRLAHLFAGKFRQSAARKRNHTPPGEIAVPEKK